MDKEWTERLSITTWLDELTLEDPRVVHLRLHSRAALTLAQLLLAGMQHGLLVQLRTGPHWPARVRAVSIERGVGSMCVLTTITPSGSGGWGTREWRERARPGMPLHVMVRVDTDGPPDSVALTERQWEIVQHVVAGGGNKEIAHALGISEQTVKNSMTQIYARTGFHSRAELGLWYAHHAPPHVPLPEAVTH